MATLKKHIATDAVKMSGGGENLIHWWWECKLVN